MIINKDELSIYDVESLHKELLEELKGESCLVDMKSVNKIDMSVIQLFIAMHKSCTQKEKTLELTNVNEELQTIFENAVCSFLLGGSHD